MEYMKAALLRAPGRLEVEDVPIPPCPPSGILVEVKACAICTSDVKMAKFGHPALVYPRILGHEVSGVVVKSRTRNFRERERIQIFPGLRCGRCIACQRGADNQCKHIEILGFSREGGMAAFLAVPLKGPVYGSVNSISEGVSFEEAALAEPLACCLNAQERSLVNSGDTVLIMGAGPMGCLNAMLARTKGAKRIFLADVFEKRRETAAFVQADLIIDPGREDICQIVRKETKGWGIDVLILASSEVLPGPDLLEALAFRGRICLFSGLSAGDVLQPFDLNLIHYKEACLLGAYGCTADQNTKACELISSKKIKVKELINKTISLTGIQEGIDYVAERKGMKAVVTEF